MFWEVLLCPVLTARNGRIALPWILHGVGFPVQRASMKTQHSRIAATAALQLLRPQPAAASALATGLASTIPTILSVKWPGLAVMARLSGRGSNDEFSNTRDCFRRRPTVQLKQNKAWILPLLTQTICFTVTIFLIIHVCECIHTKCVSAMPLNDPDGDFLGRIY